MTRLLRTTGRGESDAAMAVNIADAALGGWTALQILPCGVRP